MSGMVEFVTWIMNRVLRHLWWIGAIVLTGLMFVMSGDFSWSNVVFSLIVLFFMAVAFAVVAQMRRALNPAQGQKEP